MDDPSHRDRLEATARLFGAELEQVAAQPGVVEASQEEVVGVGDVSELIRLYAHLTGRRFRQVEHWQEGFEDGQPDVLVIRAARLESEMVEHLMGLPRASGPLGIVWGRSDTELYGQVLTRSAAAFLNGAGATRRIDIVETATSVKHQVLPGLDLLGRKASVEEIHDAVGHGAGVLTLFSHSWGWNALVSAPKTVLCGIDRPPPDADPRLGPTCLATGFCDAVGLEVKEALEKRRIISPDALAARVLVLASCRNALVGSEMLDEAWGFLPRILSNPRIGAVLATPEPSTTSYASISDELCKPLHDGKAAGPALQGYERSAFADQVGHRMLLFGDPRVKAVGRDPKPVPLKLNPRFVMGESLSEHGTGSVISPTAELDLLHEVASHVTPGGAAAKTSDRAIQALDEYEQASNGQASALRENLRRAVLEHLRTMKGRPSEAWLGRSDLHRCTEKLECPNCGWLTRPFVGTPQSGAARRLLICPRCVMALDHPLSCRLHVSFTSRGIELGGQIPTKDWTAAVIMVPPRISDAQIYWWGRAVSGAPQHLFDWAQVSWLAGPLEVRVAFMDGMTISGFGALVRAYQEELEQLEDPRANTGSTNGGMRVLVSTAKTSPTVAS